MSDDQKVRHAARIELLYARLKRAGVVMTYTGGKIVLEGDSRLLNVQTQAAIACRRGAFIALLEMDRIISDIGRTIARE